MKALLSIALLTAAFSCSAQAIASPITFTDDTAAFSAQHNYRFGLITDEFTFSLDGAYNFNAVVTSIALHSSTVKDWDFSKVQLLGNGQAYDFAPTASSTDNLEVWELQPVSLTAGAYSLRVSGYVPSGARSGSYSGNLNLSPVPEPRSWALMAAALVALAFQLNRKPRR